MSAGVASARGECRCGKVRFSVTGQPLLTMACHCRGCQQLTGGPYSLSIAYPQTAFTHDEGEIAIGGLHGESRYVFCAHCKSWLWTEPDGMGIVNLRTPQLADPPAGPPILEVATDEGFTWARIGARFSFTGMPNEDDYVTVLEAFARG